MRLTDGRIDGQTDRQLSPD